MDSVSEMPVSEPTRASGSWITAAVAVAGLIVIAVVVAATVTSNGKGAGFGPVTRAQDRAAQSDLRNALTAEKTIYTDNQAYSSKLAEMRSIESSLDWGGRLHVVVGSLRAPLPRDAQVVCLTEHSRSSGPTFSIGADTYTKELCDAGVVCLDERSDSGTTSLGDVASGAMAGTYYGKRACPEVATQEAVSALGPSWDGSSSVSWGGTLEPAPDSRCQTEMDTFRTAIAAYQAIGPNPWPEGDATTIRTKLVFAGLLQKEWRLQYNSSTTPPKANTWYYDSATHQFTSRCDA